MQNLVDIGNFIHYLASVVAQGDYLNVWIKLVPIAIRPEVQDVGKWLASLIYTKGG